MDKEKAGKGVGGKEEGERERTEMPGNTHTCVRLPQSHLDKEAFVVPSN